MKIDSIEVSVDKKEAMKLLLNKMPLMSKVSQFNTSITDIHLEYIEIKVLNYEIIRKEKTNKMFRHDIKKDYVTMLVNTYNGYSESIDNLPCTIKKYVSKSYIKKSKIEEVYIIDGVKNEILNFLCAKHRSNSIEKMNLQNITIKEVKSIYKPYWVASFRGRNILIDA